MTMLYTAIIDRPCVVMRDWYGDVTGTIDERRDIVYHHDLNTFIENVISVLPAYVDDMVKKEDTDYPEFILLVNGVPSDKYDMPFYFPTGQYFINHIATEVKRIKEEKARQANDARLEKERNEKRAREFAEKLQYEQLRKKYGN